MKIFKAFLLVLIVPLLANFATYSIWGKSSLRKRNISALMTSDFENPGDEINMDYMMWSDLNYQDSILLKGKVFPLFKVDNTGNLDDKDEVIKSLQYADSVQFIKRFIVKHEVLNELTK